MISVASGSKLVVTVVGEVVGEGKRGVVVTWSFVVEEVAGGGATAGSPENNLYSLVRRDNIRVGSNLLVNKGRGHDKG